MRSFSVVLLFFILSAGCKNSNQQSSADIMKVASKAPGLNAGIGTYSIKAPDNWIKQDTTMNGIKILFIYAPVDPAASFHPNLNVISEAMGGYSYEEYMKKNMQTMEQYITGFHIIDSGNIQVSDMQGRWVRYSQSQNGQAAENIFYVLPKNGIAYGLTATTPKGEMDKYRSDFESIVKTLQVQ